MKKVIFGLFIFIISTTLIACDSSINSNQNNNENESIENNNEKTNTGNNYNEEDASISENVEEVAAEETSATPNIADEYEHIVSTLTDGNVEISQESYDFINENSDIFPAKNKDDIATAKEITKEEVDSKHLNKKVSPYFSDIITISGNVISIEEIDYDEDTVLTYTHILDNDYNSFEIVIFESLEDVYENDHIRFWGVPVGSNHFDNISGGTTKSQFIIGSIIEKQWV